MNGLSLEEQNIMKAMAASAQHVDSAAEEERLLQMALQASSEVNDPIVDPDNPDVDNMTYEQLMEMGSNAGQVNRGYP